MTSSPAVDTSQISQNLVGAGLTAGGVVLATVVSMVQKRAELKRDREKERNAVRQRLRDERVERLRAALRLVIQALGQWFNAAFILEVLPVDDSPASVAGRQQITELITKAEDLLDRGRADLLLDADGMAFMLRINKDVAAPFQWLMAAPFLQRQLAAAQSDATMVLARQIEERREGITAAVNEITEEARRLLERLDAPVM